MRDLTRDSEDARAAVRQSLRELNEQNELLELGQEHHQYVHDIQAERLEADSQLVQSALQQRSRQIKEVLDVLRRAEGARGVYDRACQVLDEVAGHVRGPRSFSATPRLRSGRNGISCWRGLPLGERETGRWLPPEYLAGCPARPHHVPRPGGLESPPESDGHVFPSPAVGPFGAKVPGRQRPVCFTGRAE